MKALLQGTIIHESDKPGTSLSSSQSPYPISASRVLTYEDEDPLIQDQQTSAARSPQPCILLTTNIPDTAPYPIADIEPFVSGESASMVAFSLSTPTKDEPLTFEHVLEK